MLALGLKVLLVIRDYPFCMNRLKHKRRHNWLKLKAARLSFHELVGPGETMQLFLDNMTACNYIRKLEVTHCHLLFGIKCLPLCAVTQLWK